MRVLGTKHQKILLTSLLVVYALIMVVGAIIPNPQDVPVFAGNTKYFHFLGFAVLSFFVFRTVQLYRTKHKDAVSVAILGIFIVLTEVLQLFVSTRHFSLWDMLIDVGGCLVGWGLYKLIYRRLS